MPKSRTNPGTGSIDGVADGEYTRSCAVFVTPPSLHAGPTRAHGLSPGYDRQQAPARQGGLSLIVFDEVAKQGHEQVLFGHDPVSGLRAIIAIHSTALGPALGGTRF